jgi:hypothetical protein
VAGSHGVGSGGAGLDLGLDGEGDLEGERGEGIEQQLADGRVGDGRPETVWQRLAALSMQSRTHW